MKKLLALAALLALVLALAACGGSAETGDTAAADSAAVPQETGETEKTPAEDPQPVEIQLFAAASLNDSLEELIAAYRQAHPEVEIFLNADSSGTLLTQIQEGYTCDLFFSASTSQMDTLEEEGRLVEGSRVELLCNQLVVITWAGSGTAVTGLENLDQAASLALADGSVPAGQYTRTALQAMGVLDNTLTAKEITTAQVSQALNGLTINECSNVTKVLQAVAEGANEVGTVYYSDAVNSLDQVEILEMVPQSLTGPIVYPAALVEREGAEAEQAAARDFLSYLQSEEGLAVFARYGFSQYTGQDNG